jgi:hypothetical protein
MDLTAQVFHLHVIAEEVSRVAEPCVGRMGARLAQ